jgi:hypothetical protein
MVQTRTLFALIRLRKYIFLAIIDYHRWSNEKVRGKVTKRFFFLKVEVGCFLGKEDCSLDSLYCQSVCAVFVRVATQILQGC